MTELYIIIIGNPVEGFEYLGPFKTRGDAIEFGEGLSNIGGDYWIASLQSPLED